MLFLCFVLQTVPMEAQVDKRDVRAGNRKFRKNELREAEIDYRKGIVKDSLSVASNYSVSDVFVIVRDKDGNQLLKNIWRSECYHSREIPMTATRSTFGKDGEGNLSTLYADVEALAGQGNTIEISLQIATGEKLIAFRGELTN